MTERVLLEMSVVLYRQFEHMKVLFEWSLEELLQELHASGTLQQLMDVEKPFQQVDCREQVRAGQGQCPGRYGQSQGVHRGKLPEGSQH